MKTILEENARRNALEQAPYNPITGEGCGGERRPVSVDGKLLYLPAAMANDPAFSPKMGEHAMTMMRFRYDFEFWAARCVVIHDKLTGSDVPFVLNRPQRRVLGIIERQRLEGRPIRLIMLKARQWGGSTLIQVYFAWIQIIHRRNWNSIICAHVKETASTIRGMYTKLLANYPREYWEEEEMPEFRPFERSSNSRVIPGRGCRVMLASCEAQEATRGYNCSMAHLSEVAFWKDSSRRDPEDFIRAICSGISLEPLTMVAMESTANGVGTFFHREWLRAREGKSDKAAVFVPWHEIEIYRMPVADPAALWAEMDGYERRLWEEGCTLEAINWYHTKRREMPSHRAMKAEYPGSDDEAFAHTDSEVFSSADVERLRKDCRPGLKGDICGAAVNGPAALDRVRFVPADSGAMTIWCKPRESAGADDYIVSVDIGGRWSGADWSVITVLDRHLEQSLMRRPEVVAQWRGHTDHDLLAWKAAAIAQYYRRGLLVIESNSLESEEYGEGGYMLDVIGTCYRNLYRRDNDRPGFHTNRSTKSAIISQLIAAVRDGSYIERDNDACNELLQYEQLPGGGYSARRGCHDDILMTRAMALFIDCHAPRRRTFTSEDVAALRRFAGLARRR